MRCREVRRNRERAGGRLARLRVGLLRRRASEVTPTEADPHQRQLAPGERIARIDLRRLHVGLDRLAIIGFRTAETIKSALQQRVAGLEAPARGPLVLSCCMLAR